MAAPVMAAPVEEDDPFWGHVMERSNPSRGLLSRPRGVTPSTEVSVNPDLISPPWRASVPITPNMLPLLMMDTCTAHRLSQGL
ncbi:hypothetical protein ACLOJK_039085, partial [Asimina triloba]